MILNVQSESSGNFPHKAYSYNNAFGVVVIKYRNLIMEIKKYIILVIKFEDLATVITNLLSAIPWIGKDMVESNAISILSLPTIGIISPYALKSERKIRFDKSNFLSIPYSFL